MWMSIGKVRLPASTFYCKNMEINERIAAVRKEAEQLKERIKQKRDALADTTRKLTRFHRE